MKDILTKLIAQTDLRIFLSVLKNFVRFVLSTMATYRSIESKASMYTDTIIGFKSFKGICSRWSFRPNSARGSLETTAIGGRTSL